MDFNAEVARQEASLKARGYDGWYIRINESEACGCWIGDLRPCGELRTGCRPGRLVDGEMYPALNRKARKDGRT